MNKELFYLLTHSAEFSEVQPTSNDERIFEQFELLKSGKRIGNKWIVAELKQSSELQEGQSMPDFLFWLSHTPLIKADLKNKVESIFPQSDVEYLALTVNGTPYLAMNVLSKESNYLNRKKSKIDYFKDGDVKFVKKYVFNKVDHSPSIFRIEESATSLFIPAEKNSALLAGNYTGIQTNGITIATKSNKYLFFLLPLLLLIGVYLAYLCGMFKLFQPEIAELSEVKEQATPQIEAHVENPDYAISDITPIAQPGGTLKSVDNISDFKRISESNATSKMTADSGKLVIPAINTKFILNNYDLSVKSTELITAFAEIYLQTNGNSIISIDGYACNIGTEEINMKISQQRALSVKSLLEQLGVPSSKIESRWFGESKNVELKYETIEEYRRVNIYIK